MKTVPTLSLLQDLEARTESTVTIAVKTFQHLHDAALLKLPANDGWSIAQCLDHLNSYGDFYLPHIKKALDKNMHTHSTEYFKSSWLGNYFTHLMLPDSGKKYKAFKKHVPKTDLDATKVVATFIHQQELLLSYLEIAADRNIHVIRIPVSIAPFVKLKLGDVFQFLIAHNERHLKQAMQNLNE